MIVRRTKSGGNVIYVAIISAFYVRLTAVGATKEEGFGPMKGFGIWTNFTFGSHWCKPVNSVSCLGRVRGGGYV